MAEARWRITVDRDACISSGVCVAITSRRFELTDEGTRARAEVVDPDPDVVQAAHECPAEAITVVDLSNGSVVAP